MAKKNFRRTPDYILNKVKGISGNDLVVSCLVKISSTDIMVGKYDHLGISIDSNGLHFPNTIIPSASQGKHSRRNVYGEEIVRTDLPKIIKYFTIEAPNWGDWSNGSHDVDIPREVYQRDFIAPGLVNLSMECPNCVAGRDYYSILFKLDEVLNKRAANFDDRLFDLINIMQENIYRCDVNPSGSSYSDYLSSIQLAWEILPPGQRDILVKKILQNNTDPKVSQVINERVDFLLSLKPTDLIFGSSGLQRYWGAKINADLVVFENAWYGNAVYIMYDNWGTLSQRSRTELLSGKYGTNFDRIVHNDGWKGTVKKIVKSKL